jgi:hypothetical protein
MEGHGAGGSESGGLEKVVWRQANDSPARGDSAGWERSGEMSKTNVIFVTKSR